MGQRRQHHKLSQAPMPPPDPCVHNNQPWLGWEPPKGLTPPAGSCCRLLCTEPESPASPSVGWRHTHADTGREHACSYANTRAPLDTERHEHSYIHTHDCTSTHKHTLNTVYKHRYTHQHPTHTATHLNIATPGWVRSYSKKEIQRTP